jgi:HTH-type transcriptional regulator / antitoxin HigA
VPAVVENRLLACKTSKIMVVEPEESSPRNQSSHNGNFEIDSTSVSSGRTQNMTKSTRKPSKPFHPKVIKTTMEHERVLARIEELFTAKPGTPEGDELELLLLLVETYEAKEYPIDLPDPIEAIRFRMEQAKLKQKDLIPIFGSKGKVSEVLNGKRELSLTMIRKLVSELGIPAEVLLQASRAEPTECSLRKHHGRSGAGCI